MNAPTLLKAIGAIPQVARDPRRPSLTVRYGRLELRVPYRHVTAGEGRDAATDHHAHTFGLPARS
jgi:hypothetical protein